MAAFDNWAAILAAAQKPIEVRIEALDASVFLSPLTVAETLEMEAAKDRSIEQTGAWLIARSVRDGAGKPLATEDEARALPMAVFGELTTAILRLNRLMPTGEAQDVEGESGGGVEASSSSASASPSPSGKA